MALPASCGHFGHLYSKFGHHRLAITNTCSHAIVYSSASLNGCFGAPLGRTLQLWKAFLVFVLPQVLFTVKEAI